MTKTPDEIKKGLECCQEDECFGERENCPYTADPNLCVGVMCGDALALIQQLQAENATLLFLCEQFGKCVICKYRDKGLNESPCCDCLYCNGDATGSHWQWRGVQED